MFRQLIDIAVITSILIITIGTFALGTNSVPKIASSADDPSNTIDGLPTDEAFTACNMDQPGYLEAELFGTVQAKFRQGGNNLECTGKIDAFNGRSRMAFFAKGTDSGDMMFVLGIEGLNEGDTQSELPTNITIVNQSNGLFFGTQGTGRCWTDISQVPIGDDDNKAWRATGELYCAGTVPQISGPGSVTIRSLKFSGKVTRVEHSTPAETGSSANDIQI